MAEADPRTRGRRSQADRTAQTRSRIIEAVLESVSEVGFQRTTANEVTRRAGVTWGAVQHHFGGKDGMLVAVLEASFEHFASQLDDIPANGLDLEERASRFVDGAWAHFGSSQYRCTFEILLNAAGEDGGPSSSSWQSEMFRSWDRIWRRIFHDSPRTRSEHAMLGRPAVGRDRQLQWSTIVIEPHFVGVDSMPLRSLARSQQEVDPRARSPLPLLGGRTPRFDVPAAFGMGPEPKWSD